MQGVVWSLTARIATDSSPAAAVDGTPVSLDPTTAPLTLPSPPSSLSPGLSAAKGSIELGVAVHRILEDYFTHRPAEPQRESQDGLDHFKPKWSVLPCTFPWRIRI